MKINSTGIILFARPYSLTTKEGELINGVKIQYYSDDNLLPCDNGDFLGKEVVYDTLPYSELDNISSIPGVYEMHGESVTVKASDGRPIPRLSIYGVKFVNDFNND